MEGWIMGDIRTTTLGGIPFGDNAGRPSNAGLGQPYFNGESQRLELYTGAGWNNIVQETPAPTSISGNYIASNTSNTLTIYGTNFVEGATVYAIGSNNVEIQASSVTFNSLVQLTATFSGLVSTYEPYNLKVINPSGLFGVLPAAIYVNETPLWVTASGSLGNFYEGYALSTSVVAEDPDGTSLSYSSSNLPLWLTLTPSGVNAGRITGTAPLVSGSSTYSFSVTASDGVNSSSTRSFSLSVVDVTAEVLVVAGGGGGGNYGGGGGGGGMRETSSYALTSGATYTITVGNGGASAYTRVGNNPGYGSRGSDSIFADITSTGGGGGAGPSNVGSEINGGSGGGCGYESSAEGRVAGISSPVTSPIQGYPGGIPVGQSSPYPSGGGGGAGGAAETALASGRTTAGYGGPGRSSSITGIATFYAGGGGGGIAGGSGYTPSSGNIPGAGGVGGGGAGSGGNPTGNAPAGNGVDNLGGGGGGGGYSGNSGVNYLPSGTGGKGVVILAYSSTIPAISNIPAGLTYTVDTSTRSGYRVYKFTSGSGTITF
jgi:hypothetical protein